MEIPPASIVREWRALVETARLDEYLTHMRDTSYEDFVVSGRNHATWVMTRDLDDGRSEVRVLSAWDDEASIRAIVGDDITRPIGFPDDDEYLLEQPQRVWHWRTRLAR